MRFIIFASLGLLSSTTAMAAGVAPYLPINASPILENEIERLVSVADVPKLKKPYNLAVIFQGMEKIKDTHPKLYRRLSDALSNYKKKLSLTHSRTTFSISGSTDHPIPNAYGNDTDSAYYLSNRLQWQAADWLGFYLGAEVAKDNRQLSGSVLAIGTSWAQLDLGYRDHWYSPFQGQSQLISTNAESILSVTLSNNLPVEIFDTRFNYEFFLAETSNQPVLFAGEYSQDKKPLLAGFHFSFEPIKGWTFGINRTFQFGGGKRETSLSTIAKAFFDPSGADNTREGLTSDEESGNQIASFTSSINFDTAIPFTINAELAGEDTANGKNYQLGNSAISAGIFFPYLLNDKMALTYEYSKWQRAWYVNHIYQNGYTNEGYVMGHWAMQGQALSGNSLPGSSHYLKSQWQFESDHLLTSTLRLVSYDNSATSDYHSGWEADLTYSMPWNRNIVSLGLYGGKDVLGESFWQAKFSINWK